MKVNYSIIKDHDGLYWWRLDGRRERPAHGPFNTRAEAEEDFRLTVLGGRRDPNCEPADHRGPGRE